MYLPKDFYLGVLNKHDILINPDNILISCELGKNKKQGDIWEYYKKLIGQKEALHIGDDVSADIEKPKEYGIHTYYTPSGNDILSSSSMQSIVPNITSRYISATIGSATSVIFNNPFSIVSKNGIPGINTEYEMGYSVFGPVILTFFIWLNKERQKDSINSFVFMSRDGYFLKRDYSLFCNLFGKEDNSIYIGISRQLAMLASIEDEEDLIEYLKKPYSGSVRELFEDRLGLVVTEDDTVTIEECVDKHRERIFEEIERIKKNYLAYLRSMGLNSECAVVDLGFYGNNQRYLNKLLDASMMGYYFNANLSERNDNTKAQKMKACFQKPDDKTAEHSEVLKRMIFLESYLTAPYGMVREVTSEGKFITAKSRGNQKCFDRKEKINDGVRQYIQDYIELFGCFDLEPDIDVIDKYYGLCFDGSVDYSDEIKSGFYNDNAMMNRIESMLFY